jgi:hypothetical protein
MKNIHILPIEKRSFIYKDIKGNFGFSKDWIKIPTSRINQHIYITSDEEIKDVRPHKGKWQLEKGLILNKFPDYLTDLSECKLIILTTDQDLINDGVQAIDDEFLEWFVKNPSCEEVEVEVEVELVVLNEYGSEISVNSYGVEKFGYKIIIPKEKPKQLTDLEIAIKLEEIKREEVRAVNRTDLYNSILSIVKQIPRENVESDAMDATSCAYEIEQLFYKWQEVK